MAIWRLRIALRLQIHTLKMCNTYAFPRLQLLDERVTMVRCTYIASLA